MFVDIMVAVVFRYLTSPVSHIFIARPVSISKYMCIGASSNSLYMYVEYVPIGVVTSVIPTSLKR